MPNIYKDVEICITQIELGFLDTSNLAFNIVFFTDVYSINQWNLTYIYVFYFFFNDNRNSNYLFHAKVYNAYKKVYLKCKKSLAFLKDEYEKKY